jgi:hypothetical protein
LSALVAAIGDLQSGASVAVWQAAHAASGEAMSELVAAIGDLQSGTAPEGGAS